MSDQLVAGPRREVAHRLAAAVGDDPRRRREDGVLDLPVAAPPGDGRQRALEPRLAANQRGDESGREKRLGRRRLDEQRTPQRQGGQQRLDRQRRNVGSQDDDHQSAAVCPSAGGFEDAARRRTPHAVQDDLQGRLEPGRRQAAAFGERAVQTAARGGLVVAKLLDRIGPDVEQALWLDAGEDPWTVLGEPLGEPPGQH